MFDVLAGANKDVLNISELLKQPLEPQTFEVIEDEPFDPDDCFEDFGQTCMACNAEPAEGRKLLACQKCKRVKYCSRACQPGRLAPGPQGVVLQALPCVTDALARHDRRPRSRCWPSSPSSTRRTAASPSRASRASAPSRSIRTSARSTFAR